MLTLLVLLALATRADSQQDARVDENQYDCVIEPYSVVELGSSVEGILDTISVERGDLVEEDQIVAKLESRVEYADLAVARARAKMKGELEARRANYEFKKRLKERADELYTEKAISLSEKDRSETEAKVAALELQRAREAKRMAQLQLWRANEVLQRRTIRSPISGVVVDRLMSPGELVDEKPILKLADVDPLVIEVIAPADLYGEIYTGMSTEVSPEDPAAGVHAATVTVVDRVIDAASGTFRVRAELPNPDYTLPAGLRCRIRFLTPTPAAPAP